MSEGAASTTSYGSRRSSASFRSRAKSTTFASYLAERRAATSSVFGAYLNVTKAIVGAGSFALPWAFSRMGLYGGSITVVFAALLSLYTILMLLRVRHNVAARLSPRSLTYVDLAKYTFGDAGAIVVYSMSCFASLGVAGAYLVFVGSTMASLVPSISKFEFQLILFPLVVLLAMQRSFRLLSYTSMLGVVAVGLGMVATMVRGAEADGLHTPLSDYHAFRFDTFGDAFGSVAFLFAVHFLVLPIERSMKDRSKWPVSITWSSATVLVSNAAFGWFGYLFFKDAACSIVVLNLAHSVFIVIVKLTLVVDLTMSYPIVLAPGREIIENSVLHARSSWYWWQQNLVRFVLVCFTMGVAQAKEFGQVTNIVGGVAMCTLGFIMPPLMLMRLHYMTRSDEQEGLLVAHINGDTTAVGGKYGDAAGDSEVALAKSAAHKWSPHNMVESDPSAAIGMPSMPHPSAEGEGGGDQLADGRVKLSLAEQVGSVLIIAFGAFAVTLTVVMSIKGILNPPHVSEMCQG